MRNLLKRAATLVVATILIFSSSVVMAKTKKKRIPSSSTSATGSGPSVQQRLEELDQKQKILERKYELDKETAEAKAKEGPIVGAGKDGFFLKSADGAHILKIRGYIQADGRFFLSDDGGKIANQFVMRRVRPILEGTVYKYFDFRFMPDFGGGTASIQDAYADVHPFNWLRFRLGKFKEPVGLERLQGGSGLAFIERGLPTNLVPNRDLGVQVHGEAWGGVFNYAVGFFNGVFDGGSVDGDTSDGKDVAARLFVHPLKKVNVPALQGFGVGVSGTFGNEHGKQGAANLASYRSIGQQVFFSYRSDPADVANTALADGRRWRLSPQGYFYWGPFGLLGEYVSSHQKVKRGTHSQHLANSAWQVYASYAITGDKASYNGLNPKNPINPKKGHWGAFEIAGRYGELEIDSDTFPTFADLTKAARKAKAWGVGLNWYLTKNFKWQVNYDQTHFDGGASGGSDRDTEQAFFTRAQIAF